MRHPLVAMIALLLLAASEAGGQATDPNLARNIAASCASCHGTNGVSQGVVVALAGKPKQELLSKLSAFKSGAQAGTIMPQLAKGFTDEQLDLVATWFAAQPPTR